jgi:hypothetical protein
MAPAGPESQSAAAAPQPSTESPHQAAEGRQGGGATAPKRLATYSIICAVASLFILALPMMVLGVVFGGFAIKRGERRLGYLGTVLSVVFGVVSIVVGILTTPVV